MVRFGILIPLTSFLNKTFHGMNHRLNTIFTLQYKNAGNNTSIKNFSAFNSTT